MKNIEAAALSEIYCFDPSWKEGTLPLSQDCVKQFFFAGADYERERAKGIVKSLQEMCDMMNSNEEHGAGSAWHTEAEDALQKWRME